MPFPFYPKPVREKIESIRYQPGIRDTGDLEPATRTITATSEASGVVNADYSKALTLPKPSDSRLLVKRIAARLAVTIDSFDTATHLHCRVYVDAQDASHLLFDEDWTSIGEKLDAVDTYSDNKATIFNLLKDGSAHTFYFFFWVNQANNAVISLVQLWEAVGTCGTSSDGREVLRIDHNGLMSICAVGYVQGSGTLGIMVRRFGMGHRYWVLAKGTGNVQATLPSFVAMDDGVYIYGSVATDINRLGVLFVTLRSEQ